MKRADKYLPWKVVVSGYGMQVLPKILSTDEAVELRRTSTKIVK